ncbi:DpnD/PcfM family protein [Moraxella haemolytica]|uniref:DpnD/PcfM family protein n=1 Tax=Moraxella haemolytica TaxID=2904119 RepID=UPI002543BE54|nr:DpnD/PcfM family protein [Moraxella sp. ZY171148]WII95722.1 DpnD/PcfM family protein [Moraxella sp. ZY171148]
MQVYQIQIKETLSKVVKIEADSLDDAIQMAKKCYQEENIVLDWSNFVSVEFGESLVLNE